MTAADGRQYSTSNQHSGAFHRAGFGLGRGSERLRLGEAALGPFLGQRRGAGESAGLEQQDHEVVVEDVVVGVAVDQSRVPGDNNAAVMDEHLVRFQPHPHFRAAEPGPAPSSSTA